MVEEKKENKRTHVLLEDFNIVSNICGFMVLHMPAEDNDGMESSHFDAPIVMNNDNQTITFKMGSEGCTILAVVVFVHMYLMESLKRDFQECNQMALEKINKVIKAITGNKQPIDKTRLVGISQNKTSKK